MYPVFFFFILGGGGGVSCEKTFLNITHDRKMGIFTKYYADVLYYTMYRHNNIHSLTVKSSKT